MPCTSRTQLSFRVGAERPPEVEYAATASGERSLNLSEVFGQIGVQNLISAVRSGQTQWECVVQEGERRRDQECFRLRTTEGLPEGVELMVELLVHGQRADIRYRTSGRTKTGMSAAFETGVVRLVNRSVNGILAVAVANRLRERVQHKVKQMVRQQVKATVTNQVLNRNRIQTIARLRVGLSR